MSTRNSMPLIVRIVAALCFVLGVMAIVDMQLKLMSKVLFFNFNVFFLYACQRILTWGEATWPDSRQTRQAWNGRCTAAVVLGVLAVVATMMFPPFEKITRQNLGAADPIFQSFARVISQEFAGFHTFDWVAPEGLEAMMGTTAIFYDYAINLLQWEWFAIVSIVTVAVVCLRSTKVRPTEVASIAQPIEISAA